MVSGGTVLPVEGRQVPSLSTRVVSQIGVFPPSIIRIALALFHPWPPVFVCAVAVITLYLHLSSSSLCSSPLPMLHPPSQIHQLLPSFLPSPPHHVQINHQQSTSPLTSRSFLSFFQENFNSNLCALSCAAHQADFNLRLLTECRIFCWSDFPVYPV